MPIIYKYINARMINAIIIAIVVTIVIIIVDVIIVIAKQLNS